VPVAWILISNATIDTISFFIGWVKDGSLAVQPSIIITDYNQVQIAVIQEVYLESQTFLCTWHMLQAMQCHFSTYEFLALWNKIKIWVKTENLADFYQIWDEILNDLSNPDSFIQYLKENWMPVTHLWSRVA
jgi:MULE transposase domain